MYEVSVSVLDIVIFYHPHAKINTLVLGGNSLNFFHLLLPVYLSIYLSILFVTSEGIWGSSSINLRRGHHCTLMHEIALEGRGQFHQMTLKITQGSSHT